MMESLLPEWELAGYQRERTGAVLPNVSPSNVYPTSDDDLVLIAANQDSVFKRLVDVMGRPELATDIRYSTHSARGQTMTELDTLIAEWTTTLTADDLLTKLHAGGVPAGRIFRAKDMFTDPHFAAREAIVRVMHPELGELPMQNVTPHLSRTPGKVRTAGPALGEHNQEIWAGLLGLTGDEIAQYIKQSVI
jgi:formyl-CoA transferase